MLTIPCSIPTPKGRTSASLRWIGPTGVAVKVLRPKRKADIAICVSVYRRGDAIAPSRHPGGFQSIPGRCHRLPTLGPACGDPRVLVVSGLAVPFTER